MKSCFKCGRPSGEYADVCWICSSATQRKKSTALVDEAKAKLHRIMFEEDEGEDAIGQQEHRSEECEKA